MLQDNDERLFSIRTNAYYLFFCGIGRNGNPALMAANCRDRMILYQFDDKGELIGKLTKRRPSQRITVRVFYESHRLSVEVPEEFVRWQEEIGLKDRTISVKRFFDEESRIGMEDLPAHYRDFLTNPKGYVESLWEGEDYTNDELEVEVKEWQEEIERWNEKGMFVFWCGNNYWCDRDGVVTSS